MVERKLESDDLAEIVADLAHAMGTPLSVISGTAELILAELPPESSIRPDLETVVYETDKLVRTLDALLAYTRPLRPTQAAVNVRELVSAALAQCEEECEGERPHLVTEMDQSFPHVIGDEGLLRQALVHVLRNAKEASQPESEVRVSAWMEHDQVALAVDDSGRGIPPAERPRVFEPFYSTRSKAETSGLGLAVALRFVRACGGEIAVEEAPTGGARFVIKLRTADEERM